MQSNKKSKTENKKGAKTKAALKNGKSSKKEVSEESSSTLRKFLSKFLTNLCEKQYAQAHKDLENIVEAKIKGKIHRSAIKAAEEKKSKNVSNKR